MDVLSHVESCPRTESRRATVLSVSAIGPAIVDIDDRIPKDEPDR